MAAIKQLDIHLQELIETETEVVKYGFIAGIDTYDDEYIWETEAERLFVSANVQAEILAENIVNLLAPETKYVLADDAQVDPYWNAIQEVRHYIQDTEPHQLSLEGLQKAITEAI